VRRPWALIAYTTSRPWPHELPIPFDVRVFGRAEAASLNQRPFVLRLDRIARVPLTRDWFPEIATRDQGVIAIAPDALRNEILDAMTELLRRRRELVKMLDPQDNEE
jgi:N-glycosylase/DNA lyase